MAGNAILPALRRGLNRQLPLAVILTAAAIFLDTSQEIVWVLKRGVYDNVSFTDSNGLFHAGDNTCAIHYLWCSVSFGGVFGNKFAAMLAALPAAGQYVPEEKMAPYLMARCGSGRYALGKLLSAALWGGAVLALGTALFLGTLTALGMPMILNGFLYEMGEAVPYYDAMSGHGGLPYAAWAVYFAFLRGALWGGAAACVSAYLPNLFAVTVSPLVFSFLINRLCDHSPLPAMLRLDFLLQMRTWLGDPVLTAAVMTGTVLALWGLCLWLFYRKIREGRR